MWAARPMSVLAVLGNAWNTFCLIRRLFGAFSKGWSKLSIISLYTGPVRKRNVRIATYNSRFSFSGRIWIFYYFEKILQLLKMCHDDYINIHLFKSVLLWFVAFSIITLHLFCDICAGFFTFCKFFSFLISAFMSF